MLNKNRKILFIFFIFLVLVVIVANADDYWDRVTVGFAKRYLCWRDGTCPTLYGDTWFHNDSGVSIGTVDANYKIIPLFNSSTHGNITDGFVHLKDGLKLIGPSGMYKTSYSLKASGLQNHEYHAGIFINNTQDYGTNDHEKASAANWFGVSGGGISPIKTGENISIRIRDLTGSSTVTIYIMKLNVVRVGDYK